MTSKKPKVIDVVFCDDIRQEVGGKVTLVGVYATDIIVTRIPFVLPKFCVRAKLDFPSKAKHSAQMELILPDQRKLGPVTINVPKRDIPAQGMIAQLVFSPLEISDQGLLTVRIRFDEQGHVEERTIEVKVAAQMAESGPAH